MPVFPKPFVLLGAGVRSALTALRVRRHRGAVKAQHRTWRTLLEGFARTTSGRAARLGVGTTYAQFQTRVPLQTYEQLGPLIERMKRGEADVLWPGRCPYFALSSGTTTGRAKCLPVTKEMLTHFQAAARDSLLYYTARAGHIGALRGRQLFLTGPATLAPLPEAKPAEAYCGDPAAIALRELSATAHKHYFEPGEEIMRMADWPAQVQAIAERCWSRNITMLAGMPSWVLLVADALREHARFQQRSVKHLQELWPHLNCLVHGGQPLGPFVEELRQVLGPAVNFHEVYPAVEGFIAAQDADAAEGLRLMADAGLFFEFLPLRDYDESRLADLGAKAMPLEGVKPGIDYVLLVTTPAGLCRYALGDIVRFVTTTPPRLVYVGRTKLQLRAFGEHMVEKDITDALAGVCASHGWRIVNFHVAPLFNNAFTGQARGRHEWWVELKPGTVDTPTGPVLAAELDVWLQRLSADYAAKRKGGSLELPVVRLVMPGVFEKWMRQRNRWGGQHKMPRCRSDREIADELARLARFYA
jgi:hypothetical protein